MRRTLVAVLLLAIGIPALAQTEIQFENPPASDRPWVYWFWKNGNISREGITADLESMQRVGIGGVILMEVSLSVPAGKYTFFSTEWRDMFKHAVEEANRLGLVISMNSAPGWTGSGGPWVTPEQSMQKVVFSETMVAGANRVSITLPKPEAVLDYYQDIAVLAFPATTGDYRIVDIAEKALYKRGAFSSQPSVRAALPSVAEYAEPPRDAIIARDRIVDLSQFMNKEGVLNWDAPEGNWTVLRIEHTSTGQTNRPAPLPGLECDKLDTAALDAHFEAFISTLLNDIGPDAKKALVAVHLDSWEVGAQNWTSKFREEFQARRGYDLWTYLPVLNGRLVDSLEVSERFLWDLRQTVSDLIVENHGKRLRQLAQENGLWFSVEPYDMTPCDDMTLGATADVTMCEFWSKGFDTRFSVKEATSVAHVYDKPIVAAESFTSVDRWLFHPGTIKSQADWAFSEGVNRFVIHRYIHQPYLNIQPGLSLGPHGLHYERTQTWWEFSRPWHEYAARCQHVLRQGKFVSDILYLSPEGAPNVFQGPDPAPIGYKFDGCTPDALLTRATADNGAITFPGGKQYRLLVLPDTETMTPQLLAKIRDVSKAGVSIVGAPPRKSPSLSNYPECDAQVRQLAAEIWKPGSARVVVPQGSVKTESRADEPRDALANAHWIWHSEADRKTPPPAGKRYFRRVVTLPENAAIRAARMVLTADNAFTLIVNGSPVCTGDNLTELFTVDVASLLKPGANSIAIAAENKGGQPNAAGVVGALSVRLSTGDDIVVSTDAQWVSATDVDDAWTQTNDPSGWTPVHDLGKFGIPPWEDVGRKALRIDPYCDSTQIEELLHEMGVLPDFAADATIMYVHRKIDSRDVYFVSNGSQDEVTATCTFRVANIDAQLWHPETGLKRDLNGLTMSGDGRTVMPLRFDPLEGYFVVFSPRDPGRTTNVAATSDFPTRKLLQTISGPWTVTFEKKSGGAGEAIAFDELTDWAKRPEDPIRYYSGTATYTKTFQIAENVLKSNTPLHLELGRVEIMASATLNGHDLGIAWKRPFRFPISGAAESGDNTLVVRVVNLWPNRMIGDEHLPADSDRAESGTLNHWPQWMLEGNQSPTGRTTFATWKHWSADDPLLPSGLLGPVTLLSEE